MIEPATPLPWKTGRLEDGPCPSKEVRTYDREIDYLGRLVTKARTEEDAAYIMHACNAYPRLLEVLLDVISKAGFSEKDIPHDVLTMIREKE